MSKNGSSQNLVDCHSMKKDLAKQVVFASQGLSFFVVCMDTAFFKYSLLYHKIIMRFRYRPDFLGAPSYTGVCSIPVHRLDESIRISDNMISTDVPFADENRLSLQTDITGGRQWQRKRKNNRVGPALQSSRG